jgi:hypothetical protein
MTLLAGLVIGFLLGALGVAWFYARRVEQGYDLRWVNSSIKWVKR